MLLAATCLAVAFSAGATQLGTLEIQVTATPEGELIPVMGDDAVSPLVVYERFSTNGGNVYYRRLGDTSVLGEEVLVSDPTYDNIVPDIHGDRIVYTQFENPSSNLGRIMLYEISTASRTAVTQLGPVWAARLHGNRLAWFEGDFGATRLMLLDLDDPDAPAVSIAGPDPPVGAVEIDDTFVVWTELIDGSQNVAAHDLRTRYTFTVAGNRGVAQRAPVTSGRWIVWEELIPQPLSTRIVALDFDRGELRTVVDDGRFNTLPSIDRDLIAWEAYDAPNNSFHVYLHRLSTAETFQVTQGSVWDRLNVVFGQRVAYIRSMFVTPDVPPTPGDVFVSSFQFLSDPDPVLEGIIDTVNGMDPSDFVLPNMQLALSNKLESVRALIATGMLCDLCQAIDKLTHDILPKTDGEPSPPDWVSNPTAQQDLEGQILSLLQALTNAADGQGGCGGC